MAAPAVLAAVLLTRELPRLAAFRPAAEAVLAASPAPPRWGAFLSCLSSIITLRSMMSFGLTAFIPLWLVSARGVPRSRAALALTVMLLAGAAATLAGGRLADRFGRRRVLVGSLLPLAPLIALTLATPGPAVLVPLALTGAFSIASYSVGVVMGQEYLPGREGIAGGVTMGLAIGLGGAGVPLLGLVADHWGVRRGVRPDRRPARDRGGPGPHAAGAAPPQTGSPDRSVRYPARSSPTRTKTTAT